MQNMEIPIEEDIDFEISFYEDIVRESPDFVNALILLGDAYTHKGLFQKGLEVDLHLGRLRPKDAVVHYNLACDYALIKNPDAAINTLEKAIKLGYRNFRHMEKDPDLEAIRHDDRYIALARKYRRR